MLNVVTYYVQVGPSFAGHQSVVYNPQGTPVPQPYFHPNGPQVRHYLDHFPLYVPDCSACTI